MSFNIPSPPNYGGVIDVFYKLIALKEVGIEVILHCFEYGRNHDPSLKKLCKRVHYYPRKTGLAMQLSFIPYIVNTRLSKELIVNLNKDNYPILLEGLHTCSVLDQAEINPIRIWIRSHNIESDYYYNLALSSKSPFLKLYFFTEMVRLKMFEKIHAKAKGVFAISYLDANSLRTLNPNTYLVAPFHPNLDVVSVIGSGNYVLYHGDLSTEENLKALEFLVKQVDIPAALPFIVAGRNPTNRVMKLVANHSNITLVANPDINVMNQLVRDAHIHLLPTFQATGVKLKLLNVLYQGRHCIVSPLMVKGTLLDDLVIIGEDAEEFSRLISETMLIPFTSSMVSKRRIVLTQHYSNVENANVIKNCIFNIV